jgi:hypothetical protein
MRALLVIETDPVTDYTPGVLKVLESLAVNALALRRSDDPLDHAVLLRGVRRDELLMQPIAFDQGRVASTREDQAVVGSHRERLLNTPKVSSAGGQGFIQSRLCGLGSILIRVFRICDRWRGGGQADVRHEVVMAYGAVNLGGQRFVED